jgi:hypothetical protein
MLAHLLQYQLLIKPEDLYEKLIGPKICVWCFFIAYVQNIFHVIKLY